MLKKIPWLLLVLIAIIAFVVGRSIWVSLKDTRAALAQQRAKVKELTRADSLMRAYTDSLDQALAKLRAEEQQLAAERERLQNALNKLQVKYAQILARLDTVWTAGAVIHELDEAFPHWRGQVWEATRNDGVHALIVPRFFGADAAETKNKLDKSLQEISLKDSTITNLNRTVAVKDEEVKTIALKADSVRKTYDNLWGEYQGLDKKYQDLLKKKWFTLHLSAGNVLWAGGGATVGYFIGRSSK